MKRWYAENPDKKAAHLAKVTARNDRVKQEKRAWLINYLEERPCVDCGESDPVVLEFDHVRGEKKANVSGLMGRRGSLIRLQEEVAKCEVRCANCHRRVTARRGGWYTGWSEVEQSGSSPAS